VSLHVALTNPSGDAGSGVTTYLLPIEPDRAAHLAYLEPVVGGLVVLEHREVEVTGAPAAAPQGTRWFAIDLHAPLTKASSPMHVDIFLTFTYTIKPHPDTVSQGEQQMCVYEANVYHFSAYPTTSQSTDVKLGNRKMESYTRLAPVSHDGLRIDYGPYQTDAFAFHELRIHGANSAPFINMHWLERDIEVSHWGNVAFEERCLLRNTGAQLTGGFSRLDFTASQSRMRAYGQHAPPIDGSYNEISAFLPKDATGIYFRDAIGNVSTSHMRYDKRSKRTLLQVEPRFPMMGGWKADFFIGYNAPTNEFLSSFTRGLFTYYQLNVTFGTPFVQADVDVQTLRVILPEGASDIKWFAPFEMDSVEHAVHQSYLDTSGRPTLVFNKKRVVMEHNQHIQVTYAFSTIQMLREPMLIAAAIAILFLSAMFYYRVEFSLSAADVALANSHSTVDAVNRLCDLHQKLAQELEIDVGAGETAFKAVRATLASLNGSVDKECEAALATGYRRLYVAADAFDKQRESKREGEMRAALDSVQALLTTLANSGGE
jgi:oligosaccharyltransferase complex subunit alpha (ribophorin I)